MGVLKTYKKGAKKVRHKRNLRRFSFFGLGILFLFGVSIVLFHQPFLRISEVTVSVTNTLDRVAIENKVEELLSDTLYVFIPADSAVFFSRKSLEQALREAFPDIDALSIEQTDVVHLTLDATERAPAFLWCTHDENHVPSEERIGSCYYVDATGYVYRRAPQFSDGVYFTFLTESPLKLGGPLGHYVADTSEFNRIKSLVQELYESGIIGYKIKSYEGDYALSIERIGSIAVGPDARIFFDAENTLKEIIDHITLTRNVDDFRAQLDEHPQRLHYIDVRFRNKVIYNFSPNDTSYD